MVDKSTSIPIGVCEDVPVQVANCLILTDFVVLEMPEDENMSIILGRPFLNTAGLLLIVIKGRSLSMSMIKNTQFIFPRILVRNMVYIHLKTLRPSRLENPIVPFQCHQRNMKLS